MSDLKTNILSMLKENRVLNEMPDASGAQDQGGTHVKGGEYIDLGPAVVSPTTTVKPDYTKGTPSQQLRNLGGSQTDHAENSDVSGAHEDKGKVTDDSIDEPGNGPKLKKGDKIVAEDSLLETSKKFLKKFRTDIKEDSGADKENQRQYDKRADGEPMHHVDGEKEPKPVKEDVPANLPGGGMKMTDTGNIKEGEEIDEAEIDEKLKGLPRIKRGSKPVRAEVGKQKSVQITHIKEDDTADMAEDINALFAGESTLTEDFKKKATLIFETAVNLRVNAIAERLEQEITEDLTKQMETAVEEITETLALKVDKYLNYIAEEWIKENAVGIENTLRANISEDFLVGLKTLFEQHYIEIPKNKIDVVGTLAKRVEDLEEKLNVQIEANADLSEENKEYKRNEILVQISEGLADSQIDKLKTLSEHVEFKNPDHFKQSVTILKESNFSKVQPARGENLTEDITTDKPLDIPVANSEMDKYTKQLSKLAEK